MYSCNQSIFNGSSTTRNSSELIKGKFGVVHGLEAVVEGHPLSMNTPSLESMVELMTAIKRCCDLAHRHQKAIKTLLVAGPSMNENA